MKRILLCIAFFLSCLPLLADGPEKKPNFCIEPGTRLYYERHKAGTGQLTQTFTPGIGYVRHRVYGKDMKLIAVEELVRIERPQNDNLVTL